MKYDRFAQELDNRLLGRVLMAFIQSVDDNKIGTLWKGRYILKSIDNKGL